MSNIKIVHIPSQEDESLQANPKPEAPIIPDSESPESKEDWIDELDLLSTNISAKKQI